MANKKKKKANRPKTNTSPSASEKLVRDKAELEESIEEEEDPEPESKLKKESRLKKEPGDLKEPRDSGKGKDKEDKDSGKGKDKEDKKKDNKKKDDKKKVIKSQARAKDPKKAGKKPNIFNRFLDYLKQVRLEIKRTTWPTGNEVLNMAIIVLVALLFFGIIIFIIDQIMVELLKLYGHLIPEPTTPAAGIKLLSGLDLTGLPSFFGGE